MFKTLLTITLLLFVAFSIFVTNNDNSIKGQVNNQAQFDTCHTRTSQGVCIDDLESTIYFEDGSFRNDVYNVTGCLDHGICND